MSQAIEIIECTTPALRKQFIHFQWDIYKGDPFWVPPLISERMAFYDKQKNPFFEHNEAALFMAKRAGNIVGSIIAIQNNRHNEQHHEKTGFFGGFELFDDDAVAKALLDTARAWVRARGNTVLRGPATLSVNDECGLLVDGFDSEPMVLMTYNPKYYAGLLERYGFTKAMDLWAWYGETAASRQRVEEGKFSRVVEIAKKRARFTVRNINMRSFDAEVERVKGVYRKAWQQNWGNISMTDHEIDHLGKNLKQLVDPDLVCLAEDKSGETIGILLGLPNVNHALRLAYPNPNTPEIWTLIKFVWHTRIRPKINAMRVVLLGVLPEHRASGADAVMIAHTYEKMKQKGILNYETSWILENNDAMNRVNEEGGAKVYKTYRMYDLQVG